MMHAYKARIILLLWIHQEFIIIARYVCMLMQSDSSMSVTQFHLHGWPKKGVPSSPQMMLELVQHSRQHWRETGFNLIAVHTATA